MSSLTNPIVYSGAGQSGVWNDPHNWTGGVMPGVADTALISKSAVLNGPIEVTNLMLLGTETDTINGAIKTDSTNACTSFMVCENAVANFAAGSSLNSLGGFNAGIDGAGTVNIAAAAGGKAAATVTAAVMKIGQHDAGVGTVNVAGVLNVKSDYIGLTGLGTVNVTGTGQANLGDLVLGFNSGAVGHLNLSGAGTVNVAGFSCIGKSENGAPGGTGTVTVSGTAKFSSDYSAYVNYGSAVTLAGGTFNVGNDGTLFVEQNATVSGHGTLSSLLHGIVDNGVIASSGGTLLITGNINGSGALQIGSGSTMDINASRISVASMTFLGTGDTLGLTAPVNGLTLTGFAAGDELNVAGVDALSWNGTNDILTLSDLGHVVSRMTLSGVAAGATFHLSHGSAGAMITMSPPAGTSMIVLPH